MQAIGLIPSDTGQPGGRKTGQNMSDYPAKPGKFMNALEAMPKGYKLPFVSIEGDYVAMLIGSNDNLPQGSGRPGSAHVPRPSNSKKNKVKYSCLCGNNVWGKPDLNILCRECEGAFQAV